MAIERQITLGYTGASLLLVTFGLVSYVATQRFLADAVSVKRTHQIERELEGLMATTTDAETAARGFALTGDESFLQPFVTAERQLPVRLALLRANIIDPAQRARLHDLESVIALRIEEARGVARTRRQSGLDAARAHVASGRGKALHDEIRAEIGTMLEAEATLLREREARTRNTARFTQATVLLGGVIALACLGIASIFAQREARRSRKLETALVESHRGMEAAKVRAESADRLKSVFLATMSHELRTPLNSILGFTGILLQGLAGSLNDEQRKQLEMVRSSARHLLALINDVLDISKLEADELTVEHAPFDAAKAVRNVMGVVEPLATAKNLSLTCTLDPGVGVVVGDRRRTEQILLNLLTNAVKFTESGGVVLEARRTDDCLEVSVTDTGIGIAPEDVETVFLPFRQLDTGLSRHQEGTGLGLAVSRRLARLLGGRIELKSALGEGSTFTLTLSVAEEECPS